MQTHGNTAYQFGLIDEMQKSYVDKLAKEVVMLIENESWDAASSARTVLIDWITNTTGFRIPSIYLLLQMPRHHLEQASDELGLRHSRKLPMPIIGNAWL